MNNRYRPARDSLGPLCCHFLNVFNTILFSRWERKSNPKNAKEDGVRTICSQFDPIFKKIGKLKIKQLDSAPNMTSTQIITQHTQTTLHLPPSDQLGPEILHSPLYCSRRLGTNFFIIETLYWIWWAQSDCFLKQQKAGTLRTQLNRTIFIDNSVSCLFWLLIDM